MCLPTIYSSTPHVSLITSIHFFFSFRFPSTIIFIHFYSWLSRHIHLNLLNSVIFVFISSFLVQHSSPYCWHHSDLWNHSVTFKPFRFITHSFTASRHFIESHLILLSRISRFLALLILNTWIFPLQSTSEALRYDCFRFFLYRR